MKLTDSQWRVLDHVLQGGRGGDDGWVSPDFRWNKGTVDALLRRGLVEYGQDRWSALLKIRATDAGRDAARAPDEAPPEPELELEPGFKRCRRCGEVKPLEAFYARTDGHAPDGRQNHCRVCVGQAQAIYRRANRARLNVYHREYKARALLQTPTEEP